MVSTSPLVLFGIDAGDPELLTRWSRAGDLPNLARIMERGSWGTTGGAEMVSEHGVWVSIFSGISRRDHGYFYFRQMEADLATLVDPVSGAPAVKRSTRTIDAFGCPPHPTLPDLWVDWLPGRFLDRVAFPGGELTQERPDFFRRSDHSDRGFFAAAGPGIAARGEIGAVDVLDLAPTFQALLGRPPTARMTGAPIRSFLA